MNQLIYSRTRIGEVNCHLCGEEEESALHLFKNCEAVKSMAFGGLWGCRLEVWQISSISELIKLCVDPPPEMLASGLDKEKFLIGMACLFYHIWGYRNEVAHGGKRKLTDYMQMLHERIEDFITGMEGSCFFGRTTGPKERWSPPPPKWLKANVDASYKEGTSALALVVRDEQGRVVFLASQLESAENAMVAELKALVWALQIAKERSWQQVVWSSDAKTIVDEVLASYEPCGWESRYSILLCRKLLQERSWILVWNARSSNTVADVTAKFTLASNNCLYFSHCLRSNSFVFPICIRDAISHDQLSLGLFV